MPAMYALWSAGSVTAKILRIGSTRRRGSRRGWRPALPPKFEDDRPDRLARSGGASGGAEPAAAGTHHTPGEILWRRAPAAVSKSTVGRQVRRPGGTAAFVDLDQIGCTGPGPGRRRSAERGP